MTGRWRSRGIRVLLVALVLGCAALGTPGAAAATTAAVAKTPIKHFVYLMQGDRTFDNYFGTYPGANGIPAGVCQVLVLDKPQNGCIRPFELNGRTVPALGAGNTLLDYQYDGGKLDGFVAAYLRQGRDGRTAMGHYDRRDLPYYWALADQYVLMDQFFASARHGIRTNRSFWVSAAGQPGGLDTVGASGYGNGPTIFDRLQKAGVSWKFYVENYDASKTFRRSSGAAAPAQTVRVPLLNYARFIDDPALASHIVDLSEYDDDLRAGTLPAVSYVASSSAIERSSRSIESGQDLVRHLVTQLMLSDSWNSSALMWSYDGSGGWYDHVKPPTVGGERLGLRVPAVLVSPYARRGQIEHTRFDYTSALRFIEDNWGVASLTGRDAGANSIAAGLDLAAPPRAPQIVTVDPPPPGQKVRVGPAYVGYLGAFGVGLLAIAGAFAEPALRRRRQEYVHGRARQQAEDGVLVGTVMDREDLE